MFVLPRPTPLPHLAALGPLAQPERYSTTCLISVVVRLGWWRAGLFAYQSVAWLINTGMGSSVQLSNALHPLISPWANAYSREGHRVLNVDPTTFGMARAVLSTQVLALGACAGQ